TPARGAVGVDAQHRHLVDHLRGAGLLGCGPLPRAPFPTRLSTPSCVACLHRPPPCWAPSWRDCWSLAVLPTPFRRRLSSRVAKARRRRRRTSTARPEATRGLGRGSQHPGRGLPSSPCPSFRWRSQRTIGALSPKSASPSGSRPFGTF